MRCWVVLWVLMIAVLGCGPKKRPHVAVDRVEVIMPDSEVTERYEVLAVIRKQAPLSVAESMLVLVARAEAASVGADALLIGTLDTYVQDRVGSLEGAVRVRRLRGRAIWFPDRH